jgi:hypothetical protein
MELSMIASLPITDPSIRFAVITASKRYGSGVFSYHAYLEHAEHNAEETGGVAIPVDIVNGQPIVPNRAHVTLDRALRSR